MQTYTTLGYQNRQRGKSTRLSDRVSQNESAVVSKNFEEHDKVVDAKVEKFILDEPKKRKGRKHRKNHSVLA